MKANTRNALMSVGFSVLYMIVGAFILVLLASVLSFPDSSLLSLLAPWVIIAVSIFFGVRTANGLHARRLAKQMRHEQPSDVV